MRYRKKREVSRMTDFPWWVPLLLTAIAIHWTTTLVTALKAVTEGSSGVSSLALSGGLWPVPSPDRHRCGLATATGRSK
jgi:hypothetical protein